MFLHTCIIPEGLLEGNTHIVMVFPHDIEYETRCEVCEELIAPLAMIVTALYEKMIEEETVT